MKEVERELLIKHDLFQVFINDKVDYWVRHQDHVGKHSLVEGTEALILVDFLNGLYHCLFVLSECHPGVYEPNGIC